jgi:hypothetical protein
MSEKNLAEIALAVVVIAYLGAIAVVMVWVHHG